MEEGVVVDSREVELTLLAHGCEPGQEARITPPLLDELLARGLELASDPVLHAEERPQIACHPALADHLLEEIAEERRLEARGEFVDHRRIAGHGFGHDDVRATQARPVTG